MTDQPKIEPQPGTALPDLIVGRDVIDEKKLRGGPADPNESVIVHIYNRKRQTVRAQSLKRKNLINRVVTFVGIDSHKHIGVVIGFWMTSGKMVIYSEDKIEPRADCDLMVIE